MSQKCIWSNREDECVKEITVLAPDSFGLNPQEKTFFVLPEYEHNFRRFMDRAVQYSRLFLGLVALSLIILLVGVLMSAALGGHPGPTVIGSSLLFLGVVMILLPFSTPETVRIMGIAKSVMFVRFFGGVTICLGAFVIVKDYFSK